MYRRESEMDRYVIEELLGTGASGQVYRAFDPDLERHVALKVLRQTDSGYDSLREARLQARLEHPHIAQIYETGERDGRQAVAMQLIEGRDLTTVCRDLPRGEHLLVFEQIASAVHFAHRSGLLHRDLKPGNVLVEDRQGSPHVFVLDFGIATEIDAPGVTLTGMAVGTPEYMAPEQLRGERSRSADVYSLGVMLFEVLAGRRPHQADSRVELMVQVMREPAPTVRRFEQDLAPDVVAVVDRALAYEPEDRYHSAGQLALDLEALRLGQPVSVRPLGRAQRLSRWIRRNRLLSGLAAAAALMVWLLGGAAMAERWRSEARAELAQEFASQAKDIEWTTRAIEMAPLHDTSKARSVLEALGGSQVLFEGLGARVRLPDPFAQAVNVK